MNIWNRFCGPALKCRWPMFANPGMKTVIHVTDRKKSKCQYRPCLKNHFNYARARLHGNASLVYTGQASSKRLDRIWLPCALCDSPPGLRVDSTSSAGARRRSFHFRHSSARDRSRLGLLRKPRRSKYEREKPFAKMVKTVARGDKNRAIRVIAFFLLNPVLRRICRIFKLIGHAQCEWTKNWDFNSTRYLRCVCFVRNCEFTHLDTDSDNSPLPQNVTQSKISLS